MILQLYEMLCDYDLCDNKIIFTPPITPEEIDKAVDQHGFTIVDYPDGTEDHFCRVHSGNSSTKKEADV